MPRNRMADLAKLPDVADPEDPAAEDSEDEYENEEDNGQNFMAAFFEEVKKIRDTIQKIQEYIDIVEHKHEDLLVAYSVEQTKVANDALDESMGKITTLANNVRIKLKRMDQENKEAGANSQQGMSADNRIRSSQHSTLSRKFVQVMTQYNDIQSANKRKYRDAIKRQCKIVDPDIDDRTVDTLLERGETAEIFKGKRLDEAEKALSDIRERHEDILRLERSLKELHDMFVDMSILVSEQGDMIDRIENSVAKSQDYVESARKKVKRAEELQAAARQKRWCCVCMMLTGAVILIVVVLDVTGTGGNE
jgi:t-SNARE complex subunit (syntaxin)